MSHIDGFKEFFRVRGRGTVAAITDFLVAMGIGFRCRPERRKTSVNRQLSRQCGKPYPTGIVCREKNADGIYEYFTKPR